MIEIELNMKKYKCTQCGKICEQWTNACDPHEDCALCRIANTLERMLEIYLI